MPTGTATLDFGVFPGVTDTSLAVTGQTGIVAGSLVEAWIRPVDTADHTDTEHMVETLKVFAANIVAGIGFTIYGFNTSEINEPLSDYDVADLVAAAAAQPGSVRSQTVGSVGGRGTRIYGSWTVAWAWA